MTPDNTWKSDLENLHALLGMMKQNHKELLQMLREQEMTDSLNDAITKMENAVVQFSDFGNAITGMQKKLDEMEAQMKEMEKSALTEEQITNVFNSLLLRWWNTVDMKKTVTDTKKQVDKLVSALINEDGSTVISNGSRGVGNRGTSGSWVDQAGTHPPNNGDNLYDINKK